MPNIITHTLFANEFLEDASTSLKNGCYLENNWWKLVPTVRIFCSFMV